MTDVQRSLNRVASAGLIAVLAVLTGFSFWSAFVGEDAARYVQASTRTVDALERVTQALAVENSTHYEYWAEHESTPRHEFEVAARAFPAELRQALRYSRGTQDGGSENADLMTLIKRQYARYLSAAQEFFLSGRHVRVRRTLEKRLLDPLYDRMSQEMAQALARERRETFRATDDLRNHEEFARTVTLVLFPLGFGLLVLFWLVRARGLRDEAERQAEMAQLERMALTDSITGLGNHRAFQEELERELARSRRHAHPLSLALIDVDEFKTVNDDNGHGHGDRVLAKLAGLLTAGRADDRAFRIGGDEFALILPYTALDQATIMLERLRAETQRSLLGSTISIGVAHLTPETADDESLREQADAALYEAKRRGRNRLVTFEEVRDEVSILSTPKVQAVRQLLAERAISIVFQPIWNIESSIVMAYEALMRPDPRYGFDGPGEVFDIAERIGRAHDLDTICRESILACAGDLPPQALLFINVSPQTLDHDALAGSDLAEAVEAAGLQPERIVLEITERAMPRLPTVIRAAQHLRAAGFRIALDDVGCGNAGLEVLRQLAVDFVKVDRSVVAAAPHDRSARAVLAAVIAFARQADSCVIAEGIEDEPMLAMLRLAALQPSGSRSRLLGAQGYLLGRPGPLPAVRPHLVPKTRAG